MRRPRNGQHVSVIDAIAVDQQRHRHVPQLPLPSTGRGVGGVRRVDDGASAVLTATDGKDAPVGFVGDVRSRVAEPGMSSRRSTHTHAECSPSQGRTVQLGRGILQHCPPRHLVRDATSTQVEDGGCDEVQLLPVEGWWSTPP